MGHVIARRAERDRTVLPRRHPGVRSVRDRGSDDGTYAKLPVWRTRWHWLNIVIPLAIAARRDVLERHHVAPEMFRDWARIESLYAEKTTGRRLIVRPDTVASVMEVSTRTVQRCRSAARELGLLADVVHGRMLSAGECFRARQQGSPQRGMANESACLIPRWLGLDAWQSQSAVDDVTPTSGRAQSAENLTLNPGFPRRANRKNELAPLARHQRKRSATHDPVRWARQRAHRARVDQLIGDLQAREHWLTAEQPGRLRSLLSRFVRGSVTWTAEDLQHVLRERERRLQLPRPTADVVRRPYALLAHYLTDVDPQNDHPSAGQLAIGQSTVPSSRKAAPWCGLCDSPTSRHLERGDGTARRCPRCHPGRSPK
ncbi:hypothetical protein KV097_18585 [Mumia sp. zg.B17]|uniref:hypothetical protein n=1 Tax=Mumia sp. zg.B17 TaxID=2855446 RepID=UPI001C6EE5A5|nr:hypothetical protein [Mumia sp. zg.B17]MBW9207950.1 hypothetical protein [Mumia sp. zg.B17]